MGQPTSDFANLVEFSKSRRGGINLVKLSLLSKIKFTLDEPSHVTIKIVDVIGVEICTLLDEQKPAGYHHIEYDPSQFSPGSFYYKIYVNEQSANGDESHRENNNKQILKESNLLVIPK